MDYRRICKYCGNPMHQIGPYAEKKPEGEPAVKFDGIYKYECINEICSKYKEIIEVDTGEEIIYQEKLSQLCNCDHTRGMHGYSLSRFSERGRIPPLQIDGKCSADNCVCEQYEPKRS